MNNSSSDKAITLAPQPASYIQFVRFSVVTSMATLLIIALIMSGSNVVRAGAQLDELWLSFGVFFMVLVFGLLLMVPVLVASLTVGYVLWRLVFQLRGSVLLGAAAAAAVGSVALAILFTGYTGGIWPDAESNVNFLQILTYFFGRIYLVAGPVAMIVGWRQYVRVQ